MNETFLRLFTSKGENEIDMDDLPLRDRIERDIANVRISMEESLDYTRNQNRFDFRKRQ